MEQHRAHAGGEDHVAKRIAEDGTIGYDAEQAVPVEPRIFLADASAGLSEDEALRGIWVNAAVEELELEQAVYELLQTSNAEGPQAYKIAAATGFEGFEIATHELLGTVARVARGIAEHGRAFVAYVDAWGTSQEDVDRFRSVYQGTWPSVGHWAESVVEDRGWWEHLDEVVDPSLRSYLRIDFNQMGREMTYDAYVVEDEERSEVHVFRLM